MPYGEAVLDVFADSFTEAWEDDDEFAVMGCDSAKLGGIAAARCGDERKVLGPAAEDGFNDRSTWCVSDCAVGLDKVVVSAADEVT